MIIKCQQEIKVLTILYFSSSVNSVLSYVVGSSARETYTMYHETCTLKLLLHKILAIRLLPPNVITVKFVMFGEMGVQTTVIKCTL